MIKKVLPTLIVVLILAIGAIYYFSGLGSQKADPWKAIPNNAALIIEVDDPENLFNLLEDGNEIWESLMNINSLKAIKHEINLIDSVQQVNSPSSGLLNNPACLSIYSPTDDSGPNVLIIISLSKDESFENAIQDLDKIYIISENIKKNELITVTNKSSDNSFYLASKDGLLLVSPNLKLIKQSLKRLDTKSNIPPHSNQLTKLRSLAGTKVDLRIFINYKELGGLLKYFSNDQYFNQLTMLNNFASWSEVDVLFKNQEVLMSGFTMIDSSASTFLSAFANMEKVKHQAINITPFNTNLLLSIGYPTFDQYPFATDISKISTSINFDFTKVINLIDGEIALVSNATKPESISRQSWFLIRTDNKAKMISHLKLISKNTKGKSADKYAGYEINHINYNGLIPIVFGDSFLAIKDNWFTHIGNFIVFGNSKENLINFIRIFETGKTLDLNENFKSISDNLAVSSNILLYIKPRDFVGKSTNYFNKETSTFIKSNETTIKNFEGLAFQFSTEKEMFFTNFYLKSNKDYQDENLALWKVQLDDVAAGKPSLVKDHKTGKYNVVVFDKSANMYLVSTDGRILWKKRVDALPESNIFEVDYFKNRKIQYLFNSPDFIYVIDKNGNNVEGYPKKINPSATNGLSLFDYDKKRNYRLVVAQSDKNVYNYTLKGKQVKGWSKPKSQNIVIEPVERLVANNKDYFILTDVDNHIIIVNRKGKQRIKLSQPLEKAKFSTFYVNQTNNKGIIVSTNKTGKLVYITSSGNLQYTDFGEFSPSHFFLYEDFNADGAKDFIYVDGDQLAVFDRFKNVLFSYQFESAISIKPEFFHLGSKQRVLGIVADQEKTVYLFDNKGNTLINKGLVGETPFTVGSLENSKELNLVTSVGNTLYNYRID